jgi:hypothetical protein
MPHSNQNTQANIESYHGALKRWLVLDTKGLRGHRIDWLVWQLTTKITHHYMHTLEMKKKGFIKKKGYGGHYYIKCGKGSPYSTQPTFENDGTWGIQSQRLPNVIYVVKFPFTKIFCCTCEWALQGNICKHEIVVIFTCINIFGKDIIKYCGTWYGSHLRGLDHMFVDP